MARKKLSRPRQSTAKPAARPRAVKLGRDPGAAFCRAVSAALRQGAPQSISDSELRRVLTAVVKVYAAKSEDAGHEIAPFLEGAVTPTEAVVAACAMIRAADLNLFDLAMWFGRPVVRA